MPISCLDYLLSRITLDNIPNLELCFQFFLDKCYYTSICFNISWLVGFLASIIERWWSHMIVVASSCTEPTSVVNCHSQMVSYMHRFIAMYSTFSIDFATIFYRFLFNDMAHFPNTNVSRGRPIVYHITSSMLIKKISYDDMYAPKYKISYRKCLLNISWCA